MKNKIILILLLSIHVYCEKFRFDNYTVFKIIPVDTNQVNLLRNLQEKETKFDFWTDPTFPNRFVNVMSRPEDQDEMETFLKTNNIKAEVTIKNVQELIERQTIKRYTRNNIRSLNWDAYYTFDDINLYMEDIVNTYSDIATLIIGGESYEGHDIKGVKISHGDGKRAIVVESGIHSREWISPATACFILSELLTSDDPEIVAAARDFDWYIFPVTNPDGYIWSHEEFRFWRKNRRPFGNNFGVDLNRNWNSNWLVTGASTDPASDIYAGPGPFSEPETRSLSSFISSIGDQIELYLSVHSYGQMLLLPFGNTTDHLANYDDALNIGRRAMGALSVRYGTQYVTGNIAEVLYEATGGSDEWVKEHLDVPIVYCLELRDLGTYGFLLPPEQILPTGQETMDGILDIIHQGRRFGYFNAATSLKISVLGFFGLLLTSLFV